MYTSDLSTCDFVIGFYDHATRYISITAQLYRTRFIDYETAVAKIRSTLYFLHDQVHALLDSVTKKLNRFNGQIHATLNVSSCLPRHSMMFRH